MTNAPENCLKELEPKHVKILFISIDLRINCRLFSTLVSLETFGKIEGFYYQQPVMHPIPDDMTYSRLGSTPFSKSKLYAH